MRYMMMTKNDPNHPVEPPTPEMYAAMGKLIEEMSKAGVLLATGGLGPNPTQVISSSGKVTITDGPFTEAKELVAGFTIIQVKSLEEAIELVKRTPNVFPNGEAVVEIRKLMDVEDFGDAFTPNPEIAKVKFK